MDQLTRASPVTLLLIAVSVAVFALTGMGESLSAVAPFLITISPGEALPEIRAGQVWRLLTPMFLHFGPIHLLFNMMATWDLGRVIEFRRGSIFYVALVVILSLASNLAQYAVTGEPVFGGMSGVVYGLLGYVWGQNLGRSDFGFVLHRQTVVIMLAWYVLCWTGLLGQIANWAHTAGLVIGVTWGYLAAVARRAR